MQPVLKNAATLALALSMAGIGSQAALAGGKSPPAAYDVTLENLSYDIYGVKLTYPKIDIKGSNITKADIEKMLAAATPSTDRLKALKEFTAGSVDIPSTNISFEAGEVKVTASCTGEKMDKITGGKIGKYTFSGCSGQVVAGDKTIASFKIGLKSGGINDYNFMHAYRLWTDKAGPDDKEAVALNGPSTLEGFSFEFTAPEVAIKGEYGKMTETSGTKVKLLSRPLKDLIAQGTALVADIQKAPADAKGPTPQQIDEMKQMALIAIEFFENIQPGSTTIENYAFTETFTDPKLGGPFSINFRIGKTENKGFDQQATDISFDAGKVTGKMGSASWKGFSFAPVMAEAKKLLTMPTDQLISETSKLRMGGVSVMHRAILSMYSNIGTFQVNDLEVNAKGIAKPAATVEDEDEDEDETPATPAPAKPATPETVDFSVKLKNFTFKMEQPFNGLPTAIRFSFDNLQIPSVLFTLDGKASSMKAYENFKKLGMETLNTSFAADTSWNKDAKELAINELSAAEASLGSVAIKGTIGNFSETMFSWDPKAIQMAAIGLTAKGVSLHAEDKGGLDKVLTIAAAEQGTTPDQLKAMVPLMTAMIPEPFASMNSVQTIKNAVLSYWENPGKLDIALKAKNGTGLGLADLIAASQDPTTLDAKLDVTATATK